MAVPSGSSVVNADNSQDDITDMFQCNAKFVIVGNMSAETGQTSAARTAAKVLKAASELLDSGGVEAVSTRAVAAAAGVQPPTIYRKFGDK
jgi:hypothetical protein